MKIVLSTVEFEVRGDVVHIKSVATGAETTITVGQLERWLRRALREAI